MGRLRLAPVLFVACLASRIAGAGVLDTTTSTDVSSTTDTTDTTTSSTEEPTTSTTEVPTTTTSSTEEPTTSTTEAPTTSTIEAPTTSTTEAPTTSTTEAPTTTTESTTTSIQSTTTTMPSTTTSLAQTTTTVTTSTLGTTSSTAPGASTTTTTAASTSTSTSTTLSPQCNAGPSFASIDCRLTTLDQLVEATPDIQSQRARLVVRLTAAQMSTDLARTACSASDAKHTKRALAQAAKRLQQYRKLLRSKPAKRTMPAQLRADLDDAGDAIRSDVQTLRATVACPGDATH